MSLHLSDKWIWDPWLTHVNGDWHLFFLQAPKSIGAADERHWHVSIGHAVSDNLDRWQLLPDALQPSAGDPELWDSYTTWTGSVLQHEGLWYLFYTGGSRAEEGRVQRIGFATSQDLIHWQKYGGNPVLVGESPHYEGLDLELWHEQAWRDPWLFRHPVDGEFHALITARVDEGPADGRGVIGHAKSPNLVDWEVLPPLTEPGDCGHMEVPQLAAIDGKHYLLFGIVREIFSRAAQARATAPLRTGIYYLLADDPLGPYPTPHHLLLGDERETFYAGKLLERSEGKLAYLPALYKDAAGQFVGALAEPLATVVKPSGRLHVRLPPALQTKDG